MCSTLSGIGGTRRSGVQGARLDAGSFSTKITWQMANSRIPKVVTLTLDKKGRPREATGLCPNQLDCRFVQLTNDLEYVH
jgi:hypothetical protein